MPVIVSYNIGDGYTFNAECVVPVMTNSKESFMEAFDLAMAAYEPDGPEYFSIFGQTFEYRHFIEWRDEQITKRTVKSTYDVNPPTVQYPEEWYEISLRNASYVANEHSNNMFSTYGAKEGAWR